MEELTAKLVATNKYGQRFYKLNVPLFLGFAEDGDIIPEPVSLILSRARAKVKDEYAHAFDFNSVDHICVSTATSYPERLVFPAVRVVQGRDPARVNIPLDGKRSLDLSDAQQKRSVKPDSVYIRRLATLNGYIFKGII